MWCAPQSVIMPPPVRELERQHIGPWMAGMNTLSLWCAAGPCHKSHIPSGAKYAGAFRGVRSAG